MAEAPVADPRQHHGIAERQGGDQAGADAVLGNARDTQALQDPWARALDHLAVDRDASRARGRDPGDHLGELALAVARDPGDAQNLAAMHGQREVLERDRPARRGIGAHALERE